MALLKRNVKALAAKLATQRPAETGSEHDLWAAMVETVASMAIPYVWAKAFKWACEHRGIWNADLEKTYDQ